MLCEFHYYFTCFDFRLLNLMSNILHEVYFIRCSRLHSNNIINIFKTRGTFLPYYIAAFIQIIVFLSNPSLIYIAVRLGNTKLVDTKRVLKQKGFSNTLYFGSYSISGNDTTDRRLPRIFPL